MCAHASNQGGWGGFFTSLLSECEILPAQLSFSRPKLFIETLDASRKEGFKITFSRSLPSAVWRLSGIVLPRCSVKKKGVLPIWHVQKIFSSEGIDSWHVLSSCEKRLFRIRRRCKTIFGEGFSTAGFFGRQRTFSERITSDVFACGRYGDIYVYTYIVQHDTFTVR